MVKFRKKGLDKYEVLERLIAFEKESHFKELEKNLFAGGPHLTSSQSLPWGDEIRHLVVEAYVRFIHGNAWPTSRDWGALKMEKEIISMMGDVLGNNDAVGNITTGGSESNACALLTAMSRAGNKGSVVLPKHSHYSFYKYSGLFGLEPIPVDPIPGTFYNVDVEQMRKAVREDTIAIIGTAGTWPYGTIDPIEEIGEIAEERDLYFHVDSCFGGFILPFLEKGGYYEKGDIPKWDFRVKSVSSISADLHKNGMVPPPASCLIFRNEELIDFAKKIAPPAGCLTGTRAAGPIAASWTMLNLLGLEGYIAISRKTMELKEAMEDGIGQIPGLKVFPDSKINLFLAYSDEYDLGPVFEELHKRGWTFATHSIPPRVGIVICMLPQNDGQVEPFLTDLKKNMRLATPIRLKAKD